MTVITACNMKQHDRFAHRRKMTGGSEASVTAETARTDPAAVDRRFLVWPQ